MNNVLSVSYGLLVFLLLVVNAHDVQSQTNKQSLFGRGGGGIGLTGGTALQYGSVAGDGAFFSSSKLGVFLGSTFSAGGFYQASIGEIFPEMEAEPGVYHDMRMGGFFLEYTYQPDKLIHLTVPLQIGIGEIQADFNDDRIGDFSEENLVVIEPGVLLEVNLLPWVGLRTGLTYRIISGVDNYRGIQADDLSGFTALLGLRFGWIPRKGGA